MDLLSVSWNVSPYIFHIGNWGLRWYSILFVLGFPIGYKMFINFYKKEGLDVNLLEPLLYALLIGTVVGARLGHCLFYEPAYYLTSEHWLEIFMPWRGGLASHGGAIGVLLSIFWYVGKYGKKNGFDTMWLLDRLGVAVCFAGCFIRLGNLMNSEIYGDVTNLPWGFIFLRNGETEPKHPTQLYEALSYLILGFALMAIYKKGLKKVYRGFLFGAFLTVLFGMRFLIEFVKEPQVEFEESMSLDMGQWLSVPFIVAGVIILVWSYAKKKSPVLEEKPDHYCPPKKSVK